MDTIEVIAREILRKTYGKKYMAFPADELEMMKMFVLLNQRAKKIM